MIICDNCKWAYSKKELTSIIKEKKYSKGIRKIYHNCPKCRKEYIAYWTNPKIRQLQGQIKQEWTKYHQKINSVMEKRKNNTINKTQTEELINKTMEKHNKTIKTIQKEIKIEMDKLASKRGE